MSTTENEGYQCQPKQAEKTILPKMWLPILTRVHGLCCQSCFCNPENDTVIKQSLIRIRTCKLDYKPFEV